MDIKFEKDEVIIKIPCGKKEIKEAPPSKSGKTKMVASTNGFAKIDGAPDDLKISINLITK